MRRWTADRAGCIYAGASTRTADELNACTVMLACDEGWDAHDGAQRIAMDLFDQPTTTGVLWLDDHDDAEHLAAMALTAVEWLNEHIAPEGHTFAFDDGLYLWPDDEMWPDNG